MNAAAALAALGVALMLGRKGKPLAVVPQGASNGGSPPPPFILNLIRNEASRADVPLVYALAWADVESGFNPNEQGDLDWAVKKPAKYASAVLKGHADNPYAKQPSLWHSYGLYMLHAAYHVRGAEDPRILLDPQVNAERALPTLARMLRQSGGDPVEARYLYVGCGKGGANCADSVRQRVRARILGAIRKYQGVT